MNLTRWLAPLAVVAVLIAAGTTAAVLAGSGGDSAPVTSGDEIAPGECSLVHNVEVCDEAAPGQDVAGMCVEGVEDCVDMIDCSLAENEALCTDDAGAEPPPVRSDEGIDPDECNLVHNIDACSPEELKEAGIGTSAP